MLLADYDAVRALWESLPGVGMDPSDEREPVGRFLDRNPGLSVLASDPSGKLVGSTLCGYDGRRGYLQHVSVASGYQGQGIGRAMVEHCLDKLQRLGVLKCNVRVFADNDQGAAFWLQLGFAHRKDLVIMQRTTQ